MKDKDIKNYTYEIEFRSRILKSFNYWEDNNFGREAPAYISTMSSNQQNEIRSQANRKIILGISEDNINTDDLDIYTSFEFDGYISHLYFSKLYKKYCDKTYKIPSKYFLIEDKFANKTAARLKKAKVKFARKKYLKLFDIVFYASLLTILKLKIALSNLVLSKEDVK